MLKNARKKVLRALVRFLLERSWMDSLTSKQSSAIFEVAIWSSIRTGLETLAKKDCKIRP